MLTRVCVCVCVCGNFILQFEHIGADTAIVTQKIFQLIGLANAVRILFVFFLKCFILAVLITFILLW
jgi:hypothetical protein